jgi:1-acyl-sn-glycerol-3-phosphate acyltransferase
MRNLRAIILLTVLLLFTFPLMPVQLLFRKLHAGWARRFPHWYHRQICRLLGVTVHIDGDVAEDKPVFLVANHISWLDIPVLSAVAPVSFIAKREVGTWPFISWLAKLQRSVFVNRDEPRKVHETTIEIMNRLRDGDHIVLFAEGTSSDGNHVLPFRTSLFGVAKPTGKDAHDIEQGIYVQTVAIAYTHVWGLPLGRRARPGVAWYGDMDIASHAWSLLRKGPLDVHVKIGKPVELEHFESRKELAAYTEVEVRQAVADILTPRRTATGGEEKDSA